MYKLFYALAVIAVVLGFMDLSSSIPGSSRETEGGALLILAAIFAIAGFFSQRRNTKMCPQCDERIKKHARICKHCKATIA